MTSYLESFTCIVLAISLFQSSLAWQDQDEEEISFEDDSSLDIRRNAKCAGDSDGRLKCTAWGDPHYVTYDCWNINYQGTCEHVLTEKCCTCDEGSLPNFHVYLTNEHRNARSRVSWARSIKIIYGDVIVILDKNKNAWVNGELITPPFQPTDDTLVFKSTSSITFAGAQGFEVSYKGAHEVTVHVPKEYAGKLCGMCGDGDANPNNDMKLKSGVATRSGAEMGDSWIVPGAGCGLKAEDIIVNPDKAKDDDLASSKKCGMLKNKSGPFKKCIDIVPETKDMYQSCLFDARATGDLSTDNADSPVCQNIAAFVEECQERRVKGVQWRRKDFCPASCKANSHYVAYMTSCPASCAAPKAPQKCKEPLKEGCACKKGYILSGDKCVPKAKCGCLYNKRYEEIGSTWLNNICTRQLTCLGGKKGVKKTSVSCRKGNCIINRDGARECVCPDDEKKSCLEVFGSGKTCSARTESRVVCENKGNADIKCPGGKKIKIVYANYGRTAKDEDQCPYGRKHNDRTDCVSSNSQGRVMTQCNGQTSCSISANNRMFGDTCPGTYKYLEIKYQCVPASCLKTGSKTTRGEGEEDVNNGNYDGDLYAEDDHEFDDFELPDAFDESDNEDEGQEEEDENVRRQTDDADAEDDEAPVPGDDEDGEEMSTGDEAAPVLEDDGEAAPGVDDEEAAPALDDGDEVLGEETDTGEDDFNPSEEGTYEKLVRILEALKDQEKKV